MEAMKDAREQHKLECHSLAMYRVVESVWPHFITL